MRDAKVSKACTGNGRLPSWRMAVNDAAIRPSASLGTSSSWPGGEIGRHNRLKSGTTDGFESLPGHHYGEG
jgi:hypothetical protein